MTTSVGAPQADFNKNFDQYGVGVEMHLRAGTYIKVTKIPAGVVLTQHRHKHGHFGFLAQGRAIVSEGLSIQQVIAPAMVFIEPGTIHKVEAVEDSVWLCIHATSLTEIEGIDEEIIA